MSRRIDDNLQNNSELGIGGDDNQPIIDVNVVSGDAGFKGSNGRAPLL